MPTTAFTDASIEQGVREYRDATGTEYRAERDAGGATWKMFRREGRALRFIVTIKCKSGNVLALHRAMLDA